LPDSPDQTNELARDSDDGDVCALAPDYDLAVSATQAQLCVPRTINDGLGYTYLSAMHFDARPSCMPVAPCRLNK
jgi:hypothetical protein